MKISYTPLHVAAREGHEEIVKLLKPLTNLKLKNSDGKTPLEMAAVREEQKSQAAALFVRENKK